MNQSVTPSLIRLPEVHGLVTAAARCWRVARDQHAAVQRRLYRLLAERDYGMLAPVFHGLLTLYEVTLNRPLIVGGSVLSQDEQALLDMIGGSGGREAPTRCSEGMAEAFSGAVQSARIMLVKVLADRIGPYPPFATPLSNADFNGGEGLFPWTGRAQTRVTGMTSVRRPDPFAVI